MEVSGETVGNDFEATWQVLRIVAGVSSYCVPGVETSYFIMDGGVVGVVVWFLQPAHCT